MPKRLAVIGGGPIGCELAQAFGRLGAEVTLLHKNGHLLDREDGDAAQILQNAFLGEGIKVVLGCSVERVSSLQDEKKIEYRSNGQLLSILVDDVLLATGRVPNVDGLNLNAVHVQFDSRRGVRVNDYLQTTNSQIYAAGDVCLKWKFTHAADAAARIVIQNALFLGRKKVSALTMPWCTYTDPEVAHVGLSEREAREKSLRVDSFVKPFNEVDRAIVDGEEEGFVKVQVRRRTDKIVGATVVARRAGEIINELTLAIQKGIRLGALADVIHAYPTQAQAIKQLGDAYNRTRLTPSVKALLAKWLAWTR